MKKRRILYISALTLFCTGALFAQGEMDAFRFSHLDLNGSARSMSMGGAFGALGGDMSSMSHNPAGIGVYRSSEVQATLGLNMAKTESSWTGITTDKSRTNFNFDNFSYVGYFPTGGDGLKSLNFGFSYNKVKDFNRRYRAVGNNLTSIADYVASRASNAFSYREADGSTHFEGIPFDDLQADNAYRNQQWLPVLGYQAGFIDKKYTDVPDAYRGEFGELKGNKWESYRPNETVLNISERGSIDEYNFSVATNISDRVFIGATLGIMDIDYRMSSYHDEYFGGKDKLELDNAIETEGTGYSFNIGVIAHPIDMLRLGVAYNSPKWYRMTDYYYAEAYTYNSYFPAADAELFSETPRDGCTEYKLRSPDRWIFSMAGIFGTTGLLSVDYEMTNYKSMRLSDRNDTEYGDNELIKEDFQLAHTVKVGGEYKVTPQFAVRAGYIWQSSPMKTTLTSSDRENLNEVLPAGTISHYSVLKSTNHITAGLGYRFTPNFYMDLACIYRIQKEKLYPFSNMYFSEPEYDLNEIVSTPANVDAKTTRLVLTVGYKF